MTKPMLKSVRFWTALRIRITLMQIRIPFLLWWRSGSDFDADPGSNFSLCCGSGSCFSSKVMLVWDHWSTLYGSILSLLAFFASHHALYGSILRLHSSWNLTVMRIRILHFTLMRIRIRLPKMGRIRAESQNRNLGKVIFYYMYGNFYYIYGKFCRLTGQVQSYG